eukprot:scpid15153/ scgid33462/ WD repeat-containing protein 36; T-cell activation WD repeat-containing protein
MASGSKVFAAFRALGIVSNDVPICIQTSHSNYFVTSAIGRAFHVYNANKLNLLFVGTTQEENITCVCCHGPVAFTAAGHRIRSWRRGKEVRSYVGHTANVHLLLPFAGHLISVDVDGHLKVWTIATGELYTEIDFEPSLFDVSAIMHPSTYMNKILVGSHQGELQLWNLRTNKMVYSFPGWRSAVTAIVQAPALDTVAIGLQDGSIIVHNIKADRTLMRFQQDWGPVMCMSFRTDGEPMLATGSSVGHIALWNLEKRQLSTIMLDAHGGSVAGMHFLQNQPMMVTNSADNSIKVWVFDQTDGSARLLRSRSGHSAPPVFAQYHGPTGHMILSAGMDRSVRILSVIRDSMNRELSQGSIERHAKKAKLSKEDLKLMPVTGLASELCKEGDWDNALTCHSGSRVVRTWNVQNRVIGKHKLVAPSVPRDASATCVSVTNCGNFGLAGFSTGAVHMFNMQSGLYRGSFGDPSAHDRSVCGVDVDNVNQRVMTLAVDGCLKIWSFRRRQHLHTLQLEGNVYGFNFHRESSLLAVNVADGQCHVVDVDMRRVVRRFNKHTKRITDMCFSPDARWLVTSSLDHTACVWDVPAARLIDHFQVKSAITSVTLSPTGDFLATTHADDLGIYLWSNKTLYSQVSLRPLPADYTPLCIDMPTTTVIDEESSDRHAVADGVDTPMEESDGNSAADADDSHWKSPDQLANELITLSTLPRSRWHNLANLDIIRRRNKPKEPPKKPEAAPFFLPTVSGLETTFDLSAVQAREDEESSRVISFTGLQPTTPFQEALKTGTESGNYQPALDLLMGMGPSATDTEFRKLDLFGGDAESEPLLAAMFTFFCSVLKSRQSFEVVQAYIALFLKLHGDTISSNPRLCTVMQDLEKLQSSTWQDLQRVFHQNLAMIGYMKSATV